MTTLFVGNLSPEVTDSDLRVLFDTYGRVTSVRLNSRRGLAYIELDPSGARAAVDGLKGVQLKGRPVDVGLDQTGKPGGYRGRRGKGRR